MPVETNFDRLPEATQTHLRAYVKNGIAAGTILPDNADQVLNLLANKITLNGFEGIPSEEDLNRMYEGGAVAQVTERRKGSTPLRGC